MIRSVRRITWLTAIWAVALGGAQGYLLENSFFDAEPIEWADGVGWEGFSFPDGGWAVGQHDWASGAPAFDDVSYGTVDDGNYGIAFQAWAATGGGFYQDVPVEAGESYRFQIQSHLSCNAPGGANYPTTAVYNIDFEWYDADPELGGTFFATNANEIVLTDGGCDDLFPPGYADPATWEWWDFTNAAPGGAAYLRVVVRWDGNGTNATGGASEAVRWDNALLTASTLDPVNQSLEPTDDLFALTFDAQTSLVYTLESSTDVETWTPTVHPEIAGDEATRTLYDLPPDPMTAWRLTGVQSALGGPYQNLIANGDLEDPGTGAAATFWTVTATNGGWANTETAGWGSGSWHFAFGHWGASGGGWAEQAVPAVAGRTYTLQAYSGADTWFLPTGRMSLNFLDNTNGIISTATRKTVDPDVYGADDGVWDELDIAHPWQTYVLDGIAPSGTVQVAVKLESFETVWNIWEGGDANATGATGSVGFDDILLTDGVTPNTNPPPAIIAFPLDVQQTTTDLIAFDGQIGVRYQLRYSEDSGATWFDTLHPVAVGDGTRQSAYDPDGPTVTRIYEMQLSEPADLPPEP